MTAPAEAAKLRKLRKAVREAVYWLGCYERIDDTKDPEYCNGEECIRCNLKRALGSAHRRGSGG